MVLYMYVMAGITEFRYSDHFFLVVMTLYTSFIFTIIFVPLGRNFDYTLNVKVTTAHALIVPVTIH